MRLARPVTSPAPPQQDAYDAFRAARDGLLACAAGGERPLDLDLTALRRPGAFNWALDWFDVIARDNDACAVRVVTPAADGGQTVDELSYAELSGRSTRLACALADSGVRQGDRLLLMTGNRLELWETMLAAFKIGAAVVPVSTQLSTDDLRDRMVRADVTHIAAETAYAERFPILEGVRNRIALDGTASGWTPLSELRLGPAYALERPTVSPEDPMLLYFTSGSTSLPKIVLHTYVSYPVGHLSTMYWLGLRPGDVHVNVSSPGWAKHAWSTFFAPWNAQATIVALRQQRFSARELLRIMVEQRATTFCAPPTVWRLLLKEDLRRWPVSLRQATSAGEPIDSSTILQVRDAWGVDVRDGYGQTETTAQIGHPPGRPGKPGSMGMALPGYSVILRDPATGLPSTEGEICLDLTERPIGLMKGYVVSGKAVLPCHDGLYRTGDLASRDEHGWFTYIGRVDDVFKASDYRISPAELESVMLEHPAVGEVGVVPSPDPVRTAVPKAYVELALGHRPDADTARALFAHARTRLSPYKRIRRLEFRTSLPKTESGKIRRALLRELEESSAGGGTQWHEADFPELKDPPADRPAC